MDFRKIGLINSALIIFVLIINYISMMQRGFSMDQFTLYILLIFLTLIISCIAMIFRARILTAILYLSVGLLSTGLSTSGDYSGVIFLIFAVLVYQKPLFYYITAILTIIAILIKALTNDLTLLQAGNIYAIYTGIFLIMHYICVRGENAAGN